MHSKLIFDARDEPHARQLNHNAYIIVNWGISMPKIIKIRHYVYTSI